MNLVFSYCEIVTAVRLSSHTELSRPHSLRNLSFVQLDRPTGKAACGDGHPGHSDFDVA